MKNNCVELVIVLNATTPGARGGIQVGSGSAGVVNDWQTMTGSQARFVATAEVCAGILPLRGKMIQKDTKGRFVYIVWRDDVGNISRRAKIYVETITQEMIDSGDRFEILLPGKAKDGLPCCATVKPIRDWHR